MSHSIRFNKDLRVIVLRAKQSMDVAEIEKAFDEILHLPEFEKGLSLVFDFRGSATPMSGAELRRLAMYAERADAKWGTTKWSFLTSNDVAYGLGRMFMAHTSQHRVTTHVFRTLKEADDWLGLGLEMNELLTRTPD